MNEQSSKKMNEQNKRKVKFDIVALLALLIAILVFFYGAGQCNQTIHPSWIIPVLKVVCPSGSTATLPGTPDSTLSPSSLQKMLDSAQIIFDADLNNSALPGWDWWGSDRLTLFNQNNSVIFLGQQSNGPQIHRQYGLQQNEACLVLMRYSGNPSFIFSGTAGSVFDSTWRSWGLNEGTDSLIPGKHMQAFYQIGSTSDFISQPLGVRDIANRWYYVLLWVNGPTRFIVRAWERDDPNVFEEKQLQMSDSNNWSDRRWNCDFLVHSGTVEMSSYMELRFTQAP